MSFIIRGELGVARDPARSDFFFNTEARFKSYWVKEDRGHACGFSDSLGRWLPYVARKL